ncbi:thiol-disulfide oxidoreductase DCC family protein [Pedobacter nanyangensis]|uniref:thiol-disulfide oxidoreductase DCC family protein n=1 Tax=Pedobacter nanyangensis TaxID=1562389 RepID=UPI000DE567F2|nr:thiol-disulfide oxidoreductase DCC family protein [Pedobacter nanyangensis]
MAKGAVIFFDGVCNLCSGAVQFVIKRDHRHYFKFASLQSDFAKATLQHFHLKAAQGDSIVLLENGRLYEQSTAVLRIVKKLPGFWPLLYGFVIVPSFIRNAIYKWIARNRYQWFGQKKQCWVPTSALKSRFLD